MSEFKPADELLRVLDSTALRRKQPEVNQERERDLRLAILAHAVVHVAASGAETFRTEVPEQFWLAVKKVLKWDVDRFVDAGYFSPLLWLVYGGYSLQ